MGKFAMVSHSISSVDDMSTTLMVTIYRNKQALWVFEQMASLIWSRTDGNCWYCDPVTLQWSDWVFRYLPL